MIKLENRNRVKIVKIRWCMMRKLVDAIYLENIDDVRTILENEPGLIDEKMSMVCLWHFLQLRQVILSLLNIL